MMVPMTDPIAVPHPLAPDLRPRPWAGTRLAPADDGIGESWIAWGGCRITEGPAAGRTPDELSAELGRAFTGSSGAVLGRGRFPLLAKLLDTAEWLSVQVHPDDAQALELEGEPGIGKSESWLVLDTGPRAELLIGRDPGTPAEEVRAAIGTAHLPDRLRTLRPSAGDRIAVPPGTLHSLGPDLLVYELQQPSDITYRVWDWGRTGRELHVGKTRRVVEAGAIATIERIGPDGLVASSPYYVAHEIRVEAGALERRSTDGTGPHAITVLDGEVELVSRGGRVRLCPWGTAVLAASAGGYELSTGGAARVIIATVP
jgi:mannose-6-phosphate isomerase